MSVPKFAAAVIAAGLTAALAACTTPADSTSGGGSGDVPKSVTDNVAAHAGPLEASYAGPAFDVGALRGKRVWWVTQYAGNPFLASIGRDLRNFLPGVTLEPAGDGPPSDAVAPLEHEDGRAQAGEPLGGTQAGEAGPDDDDIDRRDRVLVLTRFRHDFLLRSRGQRVLRCIG